MEDRVGGRTKICQWIELSQRSIERTREPAPLAVRRATATMARGPPRPRAWRGAPWIMGRLGCGERSRGECGVRGRAALAQPRRARSGDERQSRRVPVAERAQRPDHDRDRARRDPVVHRELRQPHRPYQSRWHGAARVPVAEPRQLAPDHRARRGRQHVVLGTRRQPHGPHHAARRARGIPDPDAEQPAACDRARRRRQYLDRSVRCRQDRPYRACGCDHRVRRFRRKQRAACARRGTPTATFGSRSFMRARSAASPPAGAVMEFSLPRPNSGPATSRPASTATCGSSSWRARMDGRQPDGNRVGRITPAARSPSSRCRARAVTDQHRCRSGPQRLVHEGRGARPCDAGRHHHGVSVGTNARAVGLTAGSDSQPPDATVNRLWFADGAGNKLSYLSFH